MEVDLVDDDSVILVSGEEHRLEGNEHYKKLNYKAALECYTAAIDTEPEVSLFYSNRSAANLMLHRYEDALIDAKKACDLDGNNVKALTRLCKCQIIFGNIQSAENVLEILTRLNVNNKEVLDQKKDIINYKENFLQCQFQSDKGDFRHALYCIDYCAKIACGSLTVILIRVEVLINLKRYTEAKDILEKQLNIEKNRDNMDALFLRGLCFYYLDHLDKAKTHFQHVLKSNPDHKKAQIAFKRCKKLIQQKEEGNKYVQSRHYEQARLIYTEALEIDPNHDAQNAKLYFNRALTLQKLERYDEALSDCERALTLDPLYTKVHIRRVQCLMDMERWQDAVADATKLCKMYHDQDFEAVLKKAQTGLRRSTEMDPYKVLGVSRSANEADLKKGYRKRALVHHPDRHSHADEATRKAEEQKFKEVNTAYSVLSDPRKKQMYDSGVGIDQVLGNGGGGEGGCHRNVDPREFQQFFSGGMKFNFQ